MASQYSITCYLMILIMARTRMREGEMLALQIDDIDLERSRITIRRTWGSRNTRKNLTCISRPKSGKSRQVDISPQLHATLRGYLGRTPLLGPWLFPGANSPSLPMTPNGLAWHWQRILKLANLRHRGPRTLRHTYASLKHAHGEDLTYISSQLGIPRRRSPWTSMLTFFRRPPNPVWLNSMTPIGRAHQTSVCNATHA